MMNKKQATLAAMSAALGTIIAKVDNENQLWITEASFSDKEKKIIAAALNAFEKDVERYFIKQKKKVVAFAQSHIGKAEKDPIKAFVEIMMEFLLQDNEQQIKQLADLYEAFADPLLSQIAQAACAELTADKIIESLSERAAKWLSEHKIKFAREVTQATHDAVIAAIKASETVSDAVTALMELPEFDWRRARTTARTESIAAANAGTLEGWRQSEVIEGKEWCCAGGPRSRHIHIEADGQKVGLDEPFTVGEYELMHPGDSSLGAGPEEVCNCRCTMKSVRRKAAESTKGGDKK